MYAGLWVVLRHRLTPRPVGGRILVIEKTGFGDHQCAGTRGGNRGAGRIALAQPLALDAITAANVFLWCDGEIGNGDDGRARAFCQSTRRFNPEIVSGAHALAVLGHYERPDPRL